MTNLPLKLFGFCFSSFAMLVLFASLAQAAPQAAECQSGIGQRLFATGGEVEVEILPADAGFTSELHLVSPGPARLIGTNKEPGTIARLGSFPAGVELKFAILVRETQKTFEMGSGAGNPDGLPHAEVVCFGGGRANVGFEDQAGGGDGDYNDLLCAVRQTEACSYSISPSSQSFDYLGGTGSFSVRSVSACSWAAISNANWIVINSGAAGTGDGTVRYSVAPNPNDDPRSGTITVQGQRFTISQDGLAGRPVITGAVRVGKHLFIYGVNFDPGSIVLLNGVPQKTRYEQESPTTLLYGKKTGKRARPGDTLQVQKSTGALSPGYTYNP
jgi:hypothetical protein